MKIIVVTFLLFLLSFSGYSQSGFYKQTNESETFWNSLLRQLPNWSEIIFEAEKYRLEIIYTQVNRDSNSVSFETYRYGDSASYFYPASLVKLPAAITLIDKMESTRVDKLTQLEIQSENTNDPLLGQKFKYWEKKNNCVMSRMKDSKYANAYNLVQEMLVYSSNNAFNAVYDAVGRRGINGTMKWLGMESSYVAKPLKHIEKVRKYGATPKIKYHTPSYTYEFTKEKDKQKYKLKDPSRIVGNQHYSDGELEEKGLDFKFNNRIILSELHDVMIDLFYDDTLKRNLHFINTLKWSLAAKPKEDIITLEKWGCEIDAYTNYLYFGRDSTDIPENIRVFNVVGQAYGFTSDCSYFVDTETGVEFFLSARIYTNKDEVLNDDQYEYEEIAFPFLKDLGLMIYTFEKNRKTQRSTTNVEWVNSLFR